MKRAWSRTGRLRHPADRARRPDAYERISARLEEADGGSNAELIRQMRQVHFADVDELARSGAVKIPR